MVHGPAASASPESPWEKQSWARPQTRSIRVSRVGTRTLCLDRPSRWLWCTLNFENQWSDLHQIWCQWEIFILLIHWGVVCYSAIACPILMLRENKHKMLNFSPTTGSTLTAFGADPVTFWSHSVIKILSVKIFSLKFDLISTSCPLHTPHCCKSGSGVL